MKRQPTPTATTDPPPPDPLAAAEHPYGSPIDWSTPYGRRVLVNFLSRGRGRYHFALEGSLGWTAMYAFMIAYSSTISPPLSVILMGLGVPDRVDEDRVLAIMIDPSAGRRVAYRVGEFRQMTTLAAVLGATVAVVRALILRFMPPPSHVFGAAILPAAQATALNIILAALVSVSVTNFLMRPRARTPASGRRKWRPGVGLIRTSIPVLAGLLFARWAPTGLHPWQKVGVTAATVAVYLASWFRPAGDR